jgi:beta-lactamase class A
MRPISIVLLAYAFLGCFIAPVPTYAGGANLDNFDGYVGVFAKNLRTGQTIEFNQDDVFPTASTSKLVVALAVYKYLYPASPAEVKVQYAEAIDLMIRFSDNQSFYDLLDEIDQLRFNPLTAVVRDLSLYRTKIHSREAYQVYSYSSVTTSYEMAILFESIYRESYLAPEQSATLKEALANTIFRDELPRYLPGTVMHKIGQLDDILCDVGIVDDGVDQILISIYTRTDRCEDYASNYIANTAAALYTALKSAKSCC